MPPPNSGSNLSQRNLRGTRANQPSGSLVADGTLYFVTDEDVTERSNGTAWESYSGSGGGGSTSPGTPLNTLQWNNADAFDGATGIEYVSADKALQFSGNIPEGTHGITLTGGNDGTDNATLVVDNPVDGYVTVLFPVGGDIYFEDDFSLALGNSDTAQGGLFGSETVILLKSHQNAQLVLNNQFQLTNATSDAQVYSNGAGQLYLQTSAEDVSNQGIILNAHHYITLSADGGNTIVTIGDGAIAISGDVVSNTIATVPVLVESLPAAPTEGMLKSVIDSMTDTWGATITGGGALHVLAYYNGTNWTVAAK